MTPPLTLAEVLAAQEAVRSFPPLTDEQIRKVAALLSQPEVVVSVRRRVQPTLRGRTSPRREEIAAEMTTALARLRERVAQ